MQFKEHFSNILKTIFIHRYNVRPIKTIIQKSLNNSKYVSPFALNGKFPKHKHIMFFFPEGSCALVLLIGFVLSEGCYVLQS